MNLKTALIASASIGALLLPASAHAQAYVSVFGGYASMDADAFSVGPFSDVTTYTATSTASLFVTFFGSHLVLKGTGRRQLRYTYFISRQYTQLPSFNEDSYDSGFVLGAAVGMGSRDGWRGELEFAYRNSDFGNSRRLGGLIGLLATISEMNSFIGTVYYFYGSIQSPYTVYADISGVYTASNRFVVPTNTITFNYTTAVTGNASTDGELTSFSLMANVWYDFDLGDTPITPFIGGGIGAARLDAKYRARVTMPSTTYHGFLFGPFSSTVSADSSDWVFAWQFGGGLAYEFDNGIRLSAQYRYFATDDADFAGQDISLNSHEALIGLTFPLGGM